MPSIKEVYAGKTKTELVELLRIMLSIMPPEVVMPPDIDEWSAPMIEGVLVTVTERMMAAKLAADRSPGTLTSCTSPSA
jgi:hypothetical protein